MIDRIPHQVPQILINMESLPHMGGFDVHLLGKCDVIVQSLCQMLGWSFNIPHGHSISKQLEYQHVSPNVYLFDGAKIYESSSQDSESSEANDDSSSSENESVDDDKVEFGLGSLYDEKYDEQ